MSDRRLFRHEHLVRVNDVTIPRRSWLTRSQLWAGLKHTIAVPQAIDASIDSASIEQTASGTLHRTIQRDSMTTSDAVELVLDESFAIHADPNGAFAGSTLTIRIEEPAPQALFVRFIYELHCEAEGMTEEEDNARRSAYQASDVERVRRAREFVAAVH